IVQLVSQARCPNKDTNLKPFHYWVAHRHDADCSGTPADNTGSYIEPTVIDLPDYTKLGGGFIGMMSYSEAAQTVHAAPFNLCVAQKLREIIPGAASAEAFLLNANEQLELLEVTRERTQVAMLQYAMLALLFGPQATTYSQPIAGYGGTWPT